MPYPDPKAKNDHWFTYEGVDIFIERKDKHRNAPLMSFWYSTSPQIQGPESFDVRELTPEGGVTVEDMAGGDVDTSRFDNEATEVHERNGITMHRSAGREKHKEIIKRAIDQDKLG